MRAKGQVKKCQALTHVIKGIERFEEGK